jgi:tRNA dimethylallyltransferase
MAEADATPAGARGAEPAPSRQPSTAVVAIFGPTASGKSAVAEAVADLLGTEVVSADALQVYRGLPILTNQSARRTRLVAIRALADEMSVGAYASLAHDAIDELVAAHGAAVVAGGTGLYLRAALADLGVPPAVAPERRAEAEREVEHDHAAAHARLASLDPAAARAVHPNDRRRLVRALELAESGSSLAPREDRLWAGAARHPTLVVGLDVAPDELDRRIRARADAMFEQGVVEEVRRALAEPLSRTAEQALGLQEVAELEPREALERIVVRTRRYAAYQRKWMRRIPGIVSVDANREPAVVASEIVGLVGG